MARSVIEYLRMLQSLLPHGKAWNREEGSTLTEFLYGEAEELARVDSRSEDLLTERDTRYTSELLTDHENDLGLPDECSDAEETIQERRDACHSRLIALGQQNPAYYIELAAAFGWDITITEFSPFWCGYHRSGDPCGDQTNIFYWKVTISLRNSNIVYFLSGSSQSGDSLASIAGTAPMICILNKYKPAHTILIFDFDGPAFDWAFSEAFDSFFQGSSIEDFTEGAYYQSFDSAFDVMYGGAFNRDAFGAGFTQPG